MCYKGLMGADPHECTSELVPLVKMLVNFRNWEGEQLLLIHENSDFDFMKREDLLYEATCVGAIQTQSQKQKALDKAEGARCQL